MKKLVLLALSIAIAAYIVGWLTLRRPVIGSPAPPQILSAKIARASSTNAIVSPVVQVAASDIEKVAWLEKLGQVPTNGTRKDWDLAQRTSWWGKRLDPKEFWKSRVVWCDKSAVATASAHGRIFPPIPYDDPQFHLYSDQDVPPLHAGSEGDDVNGMYSDREKAFWWEFSKTHPIPPEKI